MKMFFALLTVLVSTNVWAAVSPGKAGELALHRAGKLSDMGKINTAFVTKFSGVQVTGLAGGGAGKPAFKAVVSNSNSGRVEIIMDENGKALSHKLMVADLDGGFNLEWSNVDTLTIGENAFHYILDNRQAIARGFTSMTLTPAKDAQGKSVGKAMFRSSNGTLEVTMSADGRVISSK